MSMIAIKIDNKTPRAPTAAQMTADDLVQRFIDPSAPPTTWQLTVSSGGSGDGSGGLGGLSFSQLRQVRRRLAAPAAWKARVYNPGVWKAPLYGGCALYYSSDLVAHQGCPVRKSLLTPAQHELTARDDSLKMGSPRGSATVRSRQRPCCSAPTLRP